MNRKHALSVGLGLAGTAFFLWLALRNVNLRDLLLALRDASWIWLLPMTAIVFLDLFVRGARWRVLLSRARPDAPVLELTRLEAIGLGVNNVLFLRLGELVRGVLAARRLQMSAFAALASVVVERALDVAALLTIFIAASGVETGFVPPRIRLAAELLLAGAIAALAVLAFAESALAEGGVLERALRRWPKVHSLVEQLSLGAAVLRDPAAALQAAAWSLALWTVDAGLYWIGARALGIGSLMNYPRAVLALSWAGASSALPAAPGAIGTFEAIVKSIVVQFGATPDQAFAYALVTHMVMYLLVTVLGLILLYRIGLSLAELRTEVAQR
ncbi:MAG TPA: lysylphosphatidylglycerol synthase transmembrane domain-containing protein [Elusimicrobiota bacterium]|nr:lysylphosphatidylglycerol synthase transmembrane domain-containing protein [Elusimicrobiota bacterium]